MRQIFNSLIGLLFTLGIHLYVPIHSVNIHSVSQAQAQSNLPPQFQLQQQGLGIKLYTDHRGNYVQTVNLSQGAGIKLLFGAQGAGSSEGAYGGQSLSFQPQLLEAFWKQFTQTYKTRAFSVCNGQFFGVKELAELAFPVQINGKFITTGYAGSSEFPNEKVILGIQQEFAEIVPFSEQINIQTNSFPYQQAIVGIREDGGTQSMTWYSKAPLQNLPRTFMGVADTDGDKLHETVLILTSTHQTQSGAAQILKSFGATSVIMLDGGGSTQLIVQGKTVIQSTDSRARQIPQAIGVFNSEELK
ncbi:MAG: phosphodiester glycosidase family protein [Microcoleaceae cyanobacterium]